MLAHASVGDRGVPGMEGMRQCSRELSVLSELRRCVKVEVDVLGSRPQ